MVAECVQEELGHLLPIPVYLPECCRLVPVKADKFALVQLETNHYSIPSQYGHQAFWLKACPTGIEITNQTEIIATHTRQYGRYQEAIQANHYRQILERKPGGSKHFRTLEKPYFPPKTKTPHWVWKPVARASG